MYIFISNKMYYDLYANKQQIAVRLFIIVYIDLLFTVADLYIHVAYI